MADGADRPASDIAGLGATIAAVEADRVVPAPDVSPPGRAPAAPDARAASLALRNLRGVIILLVLSFHASLAYLASAKPSRLPFDRAPFEWLAFPIVDQRRWFGLDLFCAWQDVFLMALLFFLSGLFAAPSLARKGVRRFFRDRLVRLGAPFAFGLAVVMPIALYPVYILAATDPSPSAYARDYLALPFFPNGPMWFLWLLLAYAAVLAALHLGFPGAIARLAHWSSGAAARPGRYFAGLSAVAALAYTPLALAFTPWGWFARGPFSLQSSRPLFYAAFYFAGVGIGAYGLGRGLLAPDGGLARHWSRWLGGALATLALWMGLTGSTLADPSSTPPALVIVADASFALASASGVGAMMAVCLRFGMVRSPMLDFLSRNVFGLYLLHYAAIVWLQYALLDVPLPAIFKAAAVFAGALALSYAAMVALRAVPFASRLIGD